MNGSVFMRATSARPSPSKSPETGCAEKRAHEKKLDTRSPSVAVPTGKVTLDTLKEALEPKAVGTEDHGLSAD